MARQIRIRELEIDKGKKVRKRMNSQYGNAGIWWPEQLPHNLRPDEAKCEELEKLRRRYHMANDIFLGILLGSPAIARRVQENVYADAKKQMPDASEKDILEAVFRSRIYPSCPCGLKLTEEEVEQEMQRIHSLDDLKERVVEIEKHEPRLQKDFFGFGKSIARKIDNILEA